MKLTINREFFFRHLFVAILMAGLGGWFAYDGYIGYPSMTPQALYKQIEKVDAPSADAENRVYKNAIERQKQFMVLAFLASLAVGLHLFFVCRLDFEWSDDGFTWKGKRYALSDIIRIDRSKWERKQICVIHVNGGAIVLDAWHHNGVKEIPWLHKK